MRVSILFKETIADFDEVQTSPFATNKYTKRLKSTATGFVKISKYLSCFQLDFNMPSFA